MALPWDEYAGNSHYFTLPAQMPSEEVTDFTISMDVVTGGHQHTSYSRNYHHQQQATTHDLESGKKVTSTTQTGAALQKMLSLRFGDSSIGGNCCYCFKKPRSWKKCGKGKSLLCGLKGLTFTILISLICYFLVTQFIFLYTLPDDNNHGSSKDTSILWGFFGGSNSKKIDDKGTFLNKNIKTKPVLRDQWKHYDRGKDLRLSNEAGDIKNLIMVLFLKEMSTPLNEYLWKLSLNITSFIHNPQPLGKDERGNSGDGGDVGAYMIVRSNLAEIVKSNIQEYIHFEFHVENKENQQREQLGIQSNIVPSLLSHTVTPKTTSLENRYKNNLQYKLTEEISKYVSWLFLESSSYRCCCTTRENESVCGPKQVGSRDNNDFMILEESQPVGVHPNCQLLHLSLSPENVAATAGEVETFFDHFAIELEFKMKDQRTIDREVKCSLQMVVDEEFYSTD